MNSKDIDKLVEAAMPEIEKAARDMLLYGNSVVEFAEDGTVRSISPNSEEGKEIIKKQKDVK
jgi:hypothetical protein